MIWAAVPSGAVWLIVRFGEVPELAPTPES